MITVQLDRTREEMRDTFRKWGIDPSEFEITWQFDRSEPNRRLPGAVVRYMRQGKWQTVTSYAYTTRAANLRQIYLFLDRIRIAEMNGVQYEGLSYSTEVAMTNNPSNSERAKRETLMEAFDIVGVKVDDPIDLVKDVYRRKTMYYHPDKGGDPEKFKSLTEAYELILKSRGAS